MTSETMRVSVRTDYYDVYIGRADWCPDGWTGPGADGTFGNPVGSIHRFEHYFHQRVAADADFREAVESLRGKRLGCWCTGDKRCHGDVYVEYLEPIEGQEDDILAAMALRLSGC